jgi:hypothetical protein
VTQDQTPPDGSPEPTAAPGDAVPVGASPPTAEPPKQGMSGCAKAAIIVGAIVLVIGAALVGLAIFGVMRFAGNVEEALDESPCPFITNAEASEAIESPVEAVSGDSALAAVLGIIRDTRLLAEAPNCFISNEDSTTQVWISVHDGNDAARVFADEADVAEGQILSEESTDSGTITVESEPFRGDDVPGLGSEAFCVEVGPTVSGGVLARSEARVVFVSVLALAENQGADVLDGTLCDRATPVAAALLG